MWAQTSKIFVQNITETFGRPRLKLKAKKTTLYSRKSVMISNGQT